jgi:hypothetical protein
MAKGLEMELRYWNRVYAYFREGGSGGLAQEKTHWIAEKHFVRIIHLRGAEIVDKLQQPESL